MSKVLLALALLLGLAFFVVVVDLGISAGRIHPGVSVDGLDVGGLTVTEAADLLEQRGEELKSTPVNLIAENFDCDFTPEEVGWGPQPSDTAEDAIRVGRDDAPFGALADRVKAWIGGVNVDWAGNPSAPKVTRLINRCEEQASGLGLALDRGKLRYRIRLAIVTWPRRPFNIPLAD
jgi:hypothetical protein